MFGEKFTPPEAQEAAKEMEKRQKVKEFVVGLKEALADPNLPEDLRAFLEEELAGYEDSLAEAEATGVTIYEE